MLFIPKLYDKIRWGYKTTVYCATREKNVFCYTEKTVLSNQQKYLVNI